MDIITTTPLSGAQRGGIVAIGNFDGVHKGHQELLRLAREQADRKGVPLGVVTFEPHPRAFFMPDRPIFRITPARIKRRLLAACGVDYTLELVFDRIFASLEPEEFVHRELVERLGVSHVVTGYDFHFGHSRKGSPDTMRMLGDRWGFDVTIVDQVTDDSGIAPYSSSAIRDALRLGDMPAAGDQLGYWWAVLSEVIPGEQRGRTMGFPTVNIALEPGSQPREGVYAVRVRDAGIRGAAAWQGAGYVGRRPTFGRSEVLLEVHLLDFSGDLYGRELFVEFIEHVRDDKTFVDADELAKQITQDCAVIRQRITALDGDTDPVRQQPLGQLQAAGLL